jgi:hypothetical protein
VDSQHRDGPFRNKIECFGLDWSGSGYIELKSSCERGNESSGSKKFLESAEWLHNL